MRRYLSIHKWGYHTAWPRFLQNFLPHLLLSYLCRNSPRQFRAAIRHYNNEFIFQFLFSADAHICTSLHIAKVLSVGTALRGIDALELSMLSTSMRFLYVIMNVIHQMRPAIKPPYLVVHASCSVMAEYCGVLVEIEHCCTEKQKKNVVRCPIQACSSQKYFGLVIKILIVEALELSANRRKLASCFCADKMFVLSLAGPLLLRYGRLQRNFLQPRMQNYRDQFWNWFFDMYAKGTLRSSLYFSGRPMADLKIEVY